MKNLISSQVLTSYQRRHPLILENFVTGLLTYQSTPEDLASSGRVSSAHGEFNWSQSEPLALGQASADTEEASAAPARLQNEPYRYWVSYHPSRPLSLPADPAPDLPQY